MSGQQIVLCAYSAGSYTQVGTVWIYNGVVPCASPITLFADPAGAQPITPPLLTDSQGNFAYWLTPATYTECVTGPNVTGGCYAVQIGGTGGGGGSCSGSCVVTSPGGSQSVAQPAGTSLNVTGGNGENVSMLNAVVKADQMSGADWGAKVNACFTAAALSGGSGSAICDARGLVGTNAASTAITIPASGTLLWGAGKLTVNGANAVILGGDGASLYGQNEAGQGTVSRPQSGGFIACGNAGCTVVANTNAASASVVWVNIEKMALTATGASSKVIDLTSVGHARIQDNYLTVGTGGGSYGIFGDTSTGNKDSTNDIIQHNEIQLESSNDTCLYLAGVFNINVIEINACYFAAANTGQEGFVYAKDSNGNYPNNSLLYGNDAEQGGGGVSFGVIGYDIRGAQDITVSNNRCEKIYACIKLPSDGSAVGIHLIDNYLSISNQIQVLPNEPQAAEYAIDNNSHNWLPSQHFGLNDLAGSNLLGNADFEGWKDSTDLFYWGGVSGTTIGQAGSGIYAQQASGSAPADATTQGSFNVVIGDNATLGLGINSGCVPVDATMEYTLAFRIASTSTAVKFRPGFRFYWDANCTEADRITSASANARVLAPADYAGQSASLGTTGPNWKSTNASLSYNNGITCNCNVTGADWTVLTGSTWTPTRNYAITFRVPNAYSLSTTVTHSMRVLILENTAANPNQIYVDDVILSQGPTSPYVPKNAGVADSGPGGNVSMWATLTLPGLMPLVPGTSVIGAIATPFASVVLGQGSGASLAFNTATLTANRALTWQDVTGIPAVFSGAFGDSNCPLVRTNGGITRLVDSGGPCSGPTGANAALSNLAAVAINTSLIPGAANTVALGTAPLPFKDLFLGVVANQSVHFTLSELTTNRTLTVPDTTGRIPPATGAWADTDCPQATVVGGVIVGFRSVGGPCSGASGMNTAGSNAAATAVGASWIPGAANSWDLGTAPLPWRNVFLGIAANKAISFNFAALTTNRIWTVQDVAGIPGVLSGAFTDGHSLNVSVSGGVTSVVDSGGTGAGANTALSNLSAVAINASLVPDTVNTRDLGTALLPWRNAFFGIAANKAINFNFAALTANRLITWSDKAGTPMLTADTLLAAQMPVFTGDVTTPGASLATTVAKLQGNTFTCTTPVAGQYIFFNGSAWVCVSPQTTDNPQTGASYIVLNTDSGNVIRQTNAGAITDTVADGTETGFGVGFSFVIWNNNPAAGSLITVNRHTAAQFLINNALVNSFVLYPGWRAFLYCYDGTNWAVMMVAVPAGYGTAFQKGYAAQAGSLGSVTMVTTPADGAYDFTAAIACHAATATTVVVTLAYTDTSNTAQTLASGSVNCTALGASSVGSLIASVNAKSGTTIAYTTTAVGSTYDLHIKLLGAF